MNVNVKVNDGWWKAGGGRWKRVLKVKDPNLVGPDPRAGRVQNGPLGTTAPTKPELVPLHLPRPLR